MTQQLEAPSLVVERPADPFDVLASDADRDGVAEMLSSAFAEGRLTGPEHTERVRSAYGARTIGELAELTADLPGPSGESSIQRAPFVPDGIDMCLLCVLLICCPPLGIAWLLIARRRALGGGCGATDR